MSHEDDSEWLDALAGRDGKGSPAQREGALLRAALRHADARRPTPVPRDLVASHDAAREETLVARAVQEGLIDPPRNAAIQGRRVSQWRPLLAAVVIAAVAGGVYWQMHAPATDVIVRGGEAGPVRLQHSDPLSLRQRLLADLRAAGVEATGYESLGVHGIDADLPLPLSPALRTVLASYGIPEPADGVLRIEIRTRK